MNIAYNNKKSEVSSTAFRFLLVLLWTKDTLLDFVEEVIERLPIVGRLSPFVIPITITISVLFSLHFIFKHVKAKDIVFYLVCIVVMFASILLFPDNAPFLKESLFTVLVATAPMFFVGLSFSYERHKKDLYYASILVVLSMFAYQIYVLLRGRELDSDNMFAAYAVLPSALYIINEFFKKKNFLNSFLLAISVILIFLFGTRGPMVVLVVYIAIRLIIAVKKIKSGAVKFIIILSIISAIVLLFTGDTLIRLAELISKLFENLGFSTRIFDYFISGNIMEGTGRNVLYDTTITAIKDSPIIGNGILSDRVFISSALSISGTGLDAYAHNVFLEIWCHWGIFLGTLLLALIFCIPIKGLKEHQKDESFYFFFSLVVFVFIKLMVSGTYLNESYLLFVLGVSVTIIRNKPSKAMPDDDISKDQT